MTYCVGILLEDGLVLAADTRTAAGVDHVASFRKLTVFSEPGERVIALMSAGNLATSRIGGFGGQRATRQPRGRGEPVRVHEHVQCGPDRRERAERCDADRRRDDPRDGRRSPYQLPRRGSDSRDVRRACSRSTRRGTSSRRRPKPRSCRSARPSTESPSSIGWCAMTWRWPKRAKAALISLDSTMRSNISVGLPIDLMVYRRDALDGGTRIEVTAGPTRISPR